MVGKRKKSDPSSSCMSTNQVEDRTAKKLGVSAKSRINLLAMHYKSNDELPSSWEYNHETGLTINLPKPLTLPKKKLKRKTRSSPKINGNQLNEEEHKVWMKFKTIDEAIDARECISFPMEKDLIPVDDTDPLVDLIGEFAVDAFNKSYQTHVNEDAENDVTEAVFYDCKYYKLTSKYYFYMTIEAIEQGELGVYEVSIECDSANGARTLSKFVLTNRQLIKVSCFNNIAKSSKLIPKYEKGCLSDSSDFYKVSGMVRRRKTRGGGFNYHNPSSGLHRFIGHDGKKKIGITKTKPANTISVNNKNYPD